MGVVEEHVDLSSCAHNSLTDHIGVNSGVEVRSVDASLILDHTEIDILEINKLTEQFYGILLHQLLEINFLNLGNVDTNAVAVGTE